MNLQFKKLIARERKKLKRIFFAIITINSFFALAAWSETPQKIAKDSFPSVVMLAMVDKDDQPISLGSGFFIQENIIATNLHVIRGAIKGYGKLIGEKGKFQIMGVVAVDDEYDLALLMTKDVKAPSLSLTDSTQVSIGDEIYVVGNPLGLEGTFSQGIVSGIRKDGKYSFLQITAPISPGSSGGPVLNNQGKVIGVAFAGFDDGQNINFAIPSNTIVSLTKNIKSPVPFPKISGKENKLTEKTLSEGVEGTDFMWDAFPEIYGRFSFSIRNKLDRPVKDISWLVIFYNKRNEPIDVQEEVFSGTIRAGLARREEWTVSDKNVVKLAHRLEIRIIDFRIAE
ncbi:MAG: S1C family serine protease [Candidatus Omnitrophota bacterium]|nr:S1C family serine protease [Candidatus Omnitrophota bacterium]